MNVYGYALIADADLEKSFLRGHTTLGGYVLISRELYRLHNP